MTKISAFPIRDISQGGPLDQGSGIHMTLDIGRGQQNPTFSLKYYQLGRVCLILRKLAMAAAQERQNHGIEQRGQDFSTQQMLLDDCQISWVDSVTATSMIRFETLESLTFDLRVDYEMLNGLRDQIDRHLATLGTQSAPNSKPH